jgi:hypothetical protein
MNDGSAMNDGVTAKTFPIFQSSLRGCFFI